MKNELANILRVNFGPIVFLLIAGGLCFLLPQEARQQAVSLVIGAALTRVKRTDGSNGTRP